jgi:hypothetical protein
MAVIVSLFEVIAEIGPIRKNKGRAPSSLAKRSVDDFLSHGDPIPVPVFYVLAIYPRCISGREALNRDCSATPYGGLPTIPAAGGGEGAEPREDRRQNSELRTPNPKPQTPALKPSRPPSIIAAAIGWPLPADPLEGAYERHSALHESDFNSEH